jgi:carbonic anhydrase
VFVARVAGNIANTDILASMEYACKVSGSKLVVVLGHTNCGAVKSAIEDVKLGNITELLSKIRPAVDSLADFSGEKSAKNKEYLSKVTDENVKLTMDNIRANSQILKEMEEKGEIDIIGGLYNLDNGKVSFFE